MNSIDKTPIEVRESYKAPIFWGTDPDTNETVLCQSINNKHFVIWWMELEIVEFVTTIVLYACEMKMSYDVWMMEQMYYWQYETNSENLALYHKYIANLEKNSERS